MTRATTFLAWQADKIITLQVLSEFLNSLPGKIHRAARRLGLHLTYSTIFAGIINHVPLANLLPNTKYYYRVCLQPDTHSLLLCQNESSI